MPTVPRKTPSQLSQELHGLNAAIRQIESSDGGNWRRIKRTVGLRDRRDKLVLRLNRMGLSGEAIFAKVLDVETVTGFYETVESLNEFELKAIVRGLCLSHERLRIGGMGE